MSEAARELAKKIVREICGDYSASRKDVVDQAASLISEAVGPLVVAAQAVSDLDDGDQPFAWKHEAEFSALFDALTHWRPR